jgi:protein-L-isoaspartate(D-aspartate) O-methyltransferase
LLAADRRTRRCLTGDVGQNDRPYWKRPWLKQDETLAAQAEAAPTAVGAGAVVVETVSLTAGWPPAAPCAIILLDGATAVVSEALGRELKPNGKLACIFGRGPTGKAMIDRRIEEHLVGRPVFDAAAPVPPGFVAPPAFASDR